MVSAVSSSLYRAARGEAAFIDRLDRGRIVVTGPDRASYLQGLLTNDVVALAPGRGCYAAYLTPQGRMIADLFVYELGDIMLLSMPRAVKDTVLAKLEQFIFTEDVKLGDVTGTFAQIALVGPNAAAVLSGVLDGVSAGALGELPEHGNVRALLAGQPAIVTRTADAGEPGYDVYVELPQAAALRASLVALGQPSSDRTRPRDPHRSGRTQFGRDMDEETIPLEAGIEARAISFSKGCYVGQEVIIRVLHRGHGRVARKLVGLSLEGDAVPPAGAPVRAADKDVGHVTSSAMCPALERPIALAYLHRDFLAPGTAVSVDGVSAVVAELPFVRPGARAAG